MFVVARSFARTGRTQLYFSQRIAAAGNTIAQCITPPATFLSQFYGSFNKCTCAHFSFFFPRSSEYENKLIQEIALIFLVETSLSPVKNVLGNESVVLKTGGDFLTKYTKRARDSRCYFSLTADGQPIKLQRKLFTECFYAIAMAELSRATSLKNYMVSCPCQITNEQHLFTLPLLYTQGLSDLFFVG